MKICKMCKIEKEVEDFYKKKGNKDDLSWECKECCKSRIYMWRKTQEGQVSRRESWKKYNKSEKAKKCDDRRNKKEERKIYRKKYRNNYYHNVLKASIEFRLRQTTSSSIYQVIRDGKRNSSILQFLPYTIQELKEHLEKQFEPWMNWDNYGKCEEGKQKWNIDHIIPQSKLPYDSMEHENFQKCWALSNLRPLEAIKNMKKGNKVCMI